MRLDDEPGQARSRPGAGSDTRGQRDNRSPTRAGVPPKPVAAPASGAFADAFAKARKN
jgi:uncharacterized protein